MADSATAKDLTARSTVVADADRHPKSNPITREGLRDGSLLAAARALAAPDSPVFSDRDLAASLQGALAKRREATDIWVFGYGSLIWNPTIEYVEKRTTLLHGWHRRFCLSSTGRGSPERPGVMLALDRGGSCRGVAFRLDASRIEEELLVLWHREMLHGSYHARWLRARSEQGEIPVLAFVANRDHPRFVGHLGEADIAERIAFARGPLGSSRDYLEKTIAGLAALGLRDAGLDRIRSKVEARLKTTATE